jgi:acyl dehydratase
MNEKFRHSLDLGTRSILQSEQVIEYGRAVVAGDRVTMKSRVAEVAERPSASGPMDVLVLEEEGRDDQGELLFRCRETLILRRG